MNTEELKKRVDSYPFWYHRIDLPGIQTPGFQPSSPEKKAAYRIPSDLSGKRVLDVGAWDGFWSFEAINRGAKQVIAIDDFSDFLGGLNTSDRRAWETFDLCREALMFDAERCQRHELSVYDLTPERFGKFDVVFFFGTFYHLRYPMLALDRLASVCREEIYVESAILDDYSPYRGGLNKGYGGGQMVMEFYPGKEYADNASNWFCPTLHCLAHMVRSAGFEKVEGWKLTDEPNDVSYCRGFVRGRK